MMLRGFRVSCSLIAESQQQVLRNVSAFVLKRCNSTATVAQARPEEWDYARPFEDIPGPKPLPIIGNTWRFIPYLGNVTYCSITPFIVYQQSDSIQRNTALIHMPVFFIIVKSQYFYNIYCCYFVIK
jgi:hypothetical protein